MKTFAKLEKFLNGLAYCALTEPGTLDLCEAAGVNWDWPKTFAGDVVMEYLGLRDSIGEMRAREKMRSSIRLLEAQAHRLATIPSDIETLRIEYRELCRVQKSLDLANSILANPEAHDRILSSFDGYAPQGVKTIDYAGLVESYRFVKEEIRTKGPMVTIPKFQNLSRLIGGFNPKRITLLLAKSGGGKSILGMSIGMAATEIMAVGYMNLEMGYDDTAKRLAVLLSGKTWADHYDNRIELSDLPGKTKHEFRMSDGSELSLKSILSWAKAFKRMNEKFGLLVIDYDQKLQLETDRNTPEWKALHLAIRELEELAKRIDIHVILSAQYNREGQIASSHRMINTAHTVLSFREESEGFGIIDNSIKCRWAKNPCGLRVNYDRSGARVKEIATEMVFEIEDKAPVLATKKPNKLEEMLRHGKHLAYKQD